MAGKLAVAIVLDTSTSMAAASILQPDLTKFDIALQYAHNEFKPFEEWARSTDELDVRFTTPEVKPWPLAQFSITVAKRVFAQAKPSASHTGDLNAALAPVPPEMSARTFSKSKKQAPLKYSRRVVVITDGASVTGPLQAVASALGNVLCEVSVVLIDKGAAGRSPAQVAGETHLVAAFGDKVMAAKADSLPLGLIKPVRYSKATMTLAIGENVQMHVDVSLAVAPAKLPTMKKLSKPAQALAAHNAAAGKQVDNEFFSVKIDRQYMSTSAAGEGEESAESRQVPPEMRATGVRLGKQVLPLSADELQATLLRTGEEPACKIIVFFPAEQLLPEFRLGAAQVMVANGMPPSSQQGFSALVQAMRDLDMAAAARFFKRKPLQETWSEKPVLVALVAGKLESGDDCLWVVQMPTAEDFRNCSLPPISVERYRPGQSEVRAAASLVDAMTLPDDALDSRKVMNPALLRLRDALHARALDPEAPIPPCPPRIAKLLLPDPEVAARAEEPLKQFASTLGIRRIVPKPRAEFSTSAAAAAPAAVGEPSKRARMDGDWFSETQQVNEVSIATPEDDFDVMLVRVDKDMVDEAVEGLARVILTLVNEGDETHDAKAFACLKKLREGCGNKGKFERFNAFLADVKAAIKDKVRTALWELFKQDRFTLFAQGVDDMCNVGVEEDARKFLEEPITVTFVPSQPTAVAEDEQEDEFD